MNLPRISAQVLGVSLLDLRILQGHVKRRNLHVLVVRVSSDAEVQKDACASGKTHSEFVVETPSHRNCSACCFAGNSFGQGQAHYGQQPGRTPRPLPRLVSMNPCLSIPPSAKQDQPPIVGVHIRLVRFAKE